MPLLLPLCFSLLCGRAAAGTAFVVGSGSSAVSPCVVGLSPFRSFLWFALALWMMMMMMTIMMMMMMMVSSFFCYTSQHLFVTDGFPGSLSLLFFHWLQFDLRAARTLGPRTVIITLKNNKSLQRQQQQPNSNSINTKLL